MQVIGSVETPDILVMAWRIIEGMNIAELSVKYASEQAFHMTVKLRSPYDEDDEIYESHDIDDAVILRHLGVMKMNGMPIFDGFYPLKL